MHFVSFGLGSLVLFFTFFFFFFLLTDVFGSICVLMAQREFACAAAAMIMSPNNEKAAFCVV